ncbi:MAG: signal recognition particle-docking protein FtsY [Chloroflexi bacterium]|nr:signal recognition particle-docking protein FtsY [Chloroflexota bacterium]
MFNFLKRDKEKTKEGLTKTRESFKTKLQNLIWLDNEITPDFWTGLEDTLIQADLGGTVTLQVVDDLRARADKERIVSPKKIEGILKEELVKVLEETSPPTPLPSLRSGQALQGAGSKGEGSRGEGSRGEGSKPHVILMVGVNGSGKTTSIGKLAQYLRAQNKRVLLAAGDTFRAAAIEQLQVWGERVKVNVIAHQQGSDPGAVAFDAYQSAKANNADVLIIDTAGRLQSKTNLMKELEKIARVLQKNDPTAPHETLLVLDAVMGQNGLNQAREFKKAVPLTGILLAKLDGTAKGGIVFAIAQELKLPIQYIGTGEGLDDLAEFDAQEFVNDLFE